MVKALEDEVAISFLGLMSLEGPQVVEVLEDSALETLGSEEVSEVEDQEGLEDGYDHSNYYYLYFYYNFINKELQ